MTWTWAILIALILVAANAFYIRQRWRRAPQAYRAMMVIAGCYFIAGAIASGWILHLMSAQHVEVESTKAVVATTPSSMPAKPPAALPVALEPHEAASSLSRFSAKVIRITDGDTVDVLGPSGQTFVIRLEGIDAPEHNQEFGSQATANLAARIAGKEVTLDCTNQRSYGRLICKILLPDGEDANLDQIKAGLAWHYKQYQDEQTPADRTTYAAAECAAMKAKLGLWSDPNPEQPQDFRHHSPSKLILGPDGCRISSEPTAGAVVGNSNDHIFQWPGCPYYSRTSSRARVSFASPQAAEQAGYRPAHNCP